MKKKLLPLARLLGFVFAFAFGTAQADVVSSTPATFIHDSLSLTAGAVTTTDGDLSPVMGMCSADCGLADNSLQLSPDTTGKVTDSVSGTVYGESSGVLTISDTPTSAEVSRSSYRERMYSSL